ncbi:hypothetical protein ATCC90586_006017 [Pythium insidiosum]|nr:hypothetical protein ATCC90586_006017 [Pythium insidiosum]
MAPLLLDGKATSEHIQQHELAPACSAFQERFGRAVGLAVVVVGTRKDSATYVRMKQKASAAVGMQSWKIQIALPDVLESEPDNAAAQQQVEREIYAALRELNARDDVDGIIVQLPLPAFCDTDAILAAIAPAKDVDGLHPENHAALFQYATKKSSGAAGARPPFSVPCTPAGCLALLDHYGLPLEGKHVVVLGRSQIVGLPVSLLCLQRNATVTMCHSRTTDLAARVREADVVIAAIGRAQFVPRDWIKPGAVVLDVGINAVDDASKKSGYRLVGDVDAAVLRDDAAHAVTPVPGGIGPMTVVMLLRNTVDAAYRRVQPAK